jgi:ketosteroid isomerase-like protein
MSQENVETVHRAYETWNADDVEAGLALMHPDIEWHPSGVFPGFEPVYRGHDGVREWWRALKEPWEYFVIHVDEVVPRGDVVIADLRFEAVGRESGAGVTLPFVNVFEFEAGRVTRFSSYRSRAEALEAVGLSE